jgi:hypothetical protein
MLLNNFIVMKNRYIYAIIIAACMLITDTYAQQLYKNQLNIPTKLYQQGDSIIFMYDIDIRNLNIGSERSMFLTPVLAASAQEIMFPPILISGKKRYKAYERGKALSKEVGLASDYPILVAGKNNHTTLHYHESIPYQPWMANASMFMLEELCGCGGYEEENNRELLVEHIDLVPVVTSTPVVVPPTTGVQTKKEEFSIRLKYPVSQSVLLEDFDGNKEKIEKLNADLRRLK